MLAQGGAHRLRAQPGQHNKPTTIQTRHQQTRQWPAHHGPGSSGMTSGQEGSSGNSTSPAQEEASATVSRSDGRGKGKGSKGRKGNKSRKEGTGGTRKAASKTDIDTRRNLA